jgi:FAD/FMN-containing dehydrogenase
VALDLPIRDNTQQVVDALNEFVVAAGGRIYLAKDAFTRAEHFRAMEPRLDRWLAVRRQWDPAGVLRSAQSVRLFGDPP